MYNDTVNDYNNQSEKSSSWGCLHCSSLSPPSLQFLWACLSSMCWQCTTTRPCRCPNCTTAAAVHIDNCSYKL